MSHSSHRRLEKIADIRIAWPALICLIQPLNSNWYEAIPTSFSLRSCIRLRPLNGILEIYTLYCNDWTSLLSLPSLPLSFLTIFAMSQPLSDSLLTVRFFDKASLRSVGSQTDTFCSLEQSWASVPDSTHHGKPQRLVVYDICRREINSGAQSNMLVLMEKDGITAQCSYWFCSRSPFNHLLTWYPSLI